MAFGFGLGGLGLPALALRRGGGGVPSRALTLNGKYLTLNSQYLTLGASS